MLDGCEVEELGEGVVIELGKLLVLVNQELFVISLLGYDVLLLQNPSDDIVGLVALEDVPKAPESQDLLVQFHEFLLVDGFFGEGFVVLEEDGDGLGQFH